jgi:hypothetical protein
MHSNRDRSMTQDSPLRAMSERSVRGECSATMRAVIGSELCCARMYIRCNACQCAAPLRLKGVAMVCY